MPLYVWFTNSADTALRLTDVTRTIAKEVTLSAGRLPVDLEQGHLTALGPTGPHLVMREITRQIRGAALVPVTLDFSDGTTVEISVEAIHVQDPSESRQRSTAAALADPSVWDGER